MTMGDLIILLAVAGLVLMIGLIIVFSLVTRRRTRTRWLHDRLDLEGAPADQKRVLHIWRDGEEQTLTVPGRMTRRSLWGRLEDFRHEAGITVSLQAMILAIIGAALLAGAILLLLSKSIVASVAAAGAVLLIVRMVLRGRLRRQLKLFEEQFLDALGLAARSLRAGHPLSAAFTVISEEVSDPVGSIFAGIRQQQAMGMQLEDALRDVASNTENHDMRIFATSVIIHLRSGGSLADLVDGLAAVIRDRIRLNRRLRVLTASFQLGKNVLLVLPILLFVVINAMNPDYADPLFSTVAGRWMVGLAAGGLIVGSWLMDRLARIDV